MAGHRFKPEHVQKLHDPKREKLLPADAIMRDFGISPGDVVADLGAGSGYFTVPIAKVTGTCVYAVDIEPKMLEVLKQRTTAVNLKNIRYIVGNLENMPIEDDTVDKVVAAFVLHEVGNLSSALQEMKRILKNAGKGLVLEWEAVETEIGPPLAERISSIELEKTLRGHGFKTVLSHPHHAYYALELTPVSTSE